MAQELQKSTASEPLTIEQEYDMQRSWREDGDKLTFIACLAPKVPPNNGTIVAGQEDSDEAMIGDVNLFISEADDDEGEVESGTEHIPERDPKKRSGEVTLVGEVEIMIARKEVQGRGYGKAVLLTFLWYIFSCLCTRSDKDTGVGTEDTWRSRMKTLRVKIGYENTRSINLFQSVGFAMTSEKPNYFGELEMQLQLGDRSPVQLQTEAVKMMGDSAPTPQIMMFRLQQPK
jgi:GNAT superfamily N-acetyltransferase